MRTNFESVDSMDPPGITPEQFFAAGRDRPKALEDRHEPKWIDAVTGDRFKSTRDAAGALGYSAGSASNLVRTGRLRRAR